MEKTVKDRRYSYLTDPEVGIAVDKKAQKLAMSLPSLEIGHELAMFGCTLLLECNGKISIIDPGTYSVTFKKEDGDNESL